jgi:hypothetical protein
MKDKHILSGSVLEELIEGSPSRPEAYLVHWSIEYKRYKNYANALNIAE